jgi:hypothetical protein
VHALTDGNAYFAPEVAKDPDRPLPATVRDAILARTAEMDPHDFEVLQHTEAVAFLMTALRHLPASHPLDKASLLVRLGSSST